MICHITSLEANPLFSTYRCDVETSNADSDLETSCFQEKIFILMCVRAKGGQLKHISDTRYCSTQHIRLSCSMSEDDL